MYEHMWKGAFAATRVSSSPWWVKIRPFGRSCFKQSRIRRVILSRVANTTFTAAFWIRWGPVTIC